MPVKRPMHDPHLLICERTSRWAIAFRRVLDEATAVGEVRSVSLMDERLAELPRIAIAVDATAFGPESLLPAIARWTSAGSPVIVLAAPQQAGDELVFREAGAIHVVYSPRQLASAVQMLRRYLKSRPSQPNAEEPLRASIQARLPWARYARSVK